MTAPTTAPAAPSHSDRAVRLLAAIRVALVAALTALVLAIAALAYVVSFEAIRAFAITTAASLVILWRYLRGDAWRDPWYAWTLVGAATAVSVALNVAHAPERLAAQLFAALPPVALLGALELLMSWPALACRTPAAHQPRPWAPTWPPPLLTSRAATATAPRPRSPCPRTAHRMWTRTRRPHRMRASRCGRWSPANAQAARP